MERKRLHVPIGLPIAVIVLVVLGILAGPFIRSRYTEEQLTSNVLLSAIPFILIFAGIILAFITLIVVVAGLLNDNISERLYRVIEGIIIAGIVLGVIGMFQPWSFVAYRVGFLVLLISTLSFILWSHITPRRRQEEQAALPVGKAE